MIKPSKPSKTKKVSFSLSAPEAHDVKLAGEFNEWSEAANVMKKGSDGVWKTSVLLPPGTYQYNYVVDGQWTNDPDCQTRVRNSYGTYNCVCEVP